MFCSCLVEQLLPTARLRRTSGVSASALIKAAFYTFGGSDSIHVTFTGPPPRRLLPEEPSFVVTKAPVPCLAPTNPPDVGSRHQTEPETRDFTTAGLTWQTVRTKMGAAVAARPPAFFDGGILLTCCSCDLSRVGLRSALSLSGR